MFLKKNSSELKQMLIEAISKIEIYEDSLGFTSQWNKDDADFLNFLIEKNVISMDELIEMVQKRLLVIGREVFLQHITRKTYPDHTFSPEAFAFALKHGEFTDRERKKIKFDHGESEEEFYNLYGKNLLQKIVGQLLGKKDFTLLKTVD